MVVPGPDRVKSKEESSRSAASTAAARREDRNELMYSRWYNLTVVLFWLTAMGWLVGVKVLPPLRRGEPPDHRAVLHARREQPVVGWRMSLNGRTFGWALNSVERREEGSTEITNRVHFDELPLDKLMFGLLSSRLGIRTDELNNLAMNAETILIVDSFDRLFSFSSTVCLSNLEPSFKVHGTVEEQQLKLTVYIGEWAYPTEVPVPSGALLEDAFSPQTQLPNLHAGQTWTVPVCSPLRPNSPLEILEARVEAADSIRWNNRAHKTWRVVFRKDPGAGLSSDQAPQGTLWVTRDGNGTVLKQQAVLFGSTVTFVRLGEEEAARLQQRIREKQPFVRSQWADRMPWRMDGRTDGGI